MTPRPVHLAVAFMTALCTLIAHHAVILADTPLSSSVHRYLMGTSITIEVYGGNPGSRTEAIDEAFASMAEIDRLMSNYRPDSELAQINGQAALHPVRVSAPMWGVLSAAQLVSGRERGTFDITVGPLITGSRGFHDKKPHIPTRDELQQVRPLIGYEHMVLDRAIADRGVHAERGGDRSRRHRKGLRGRARRRRAAATRILGSHRRRGQSVPGRPPCGKSSWQVGIEDPDKPGGLLGVLDVDGGAISTSGGYHNFFVANGKTYGHLLDPQSLRPADSALSVTIVSPDATLADALSKPAFILGPVAGLKLVESFPGTLAIIATRGAGGGVVLTMSAPLRAHFRSRTT